MANISKFMSKDIADLGKLCGVDKTNLTSFMGLNIGVSKEPWEVTGLIAGYRANDLSYNDGNSILSWADSYGAGNNLTYDVNSVPMCKVNIINGKKVSRWSADTGSDTDYLFRGIGINTKPTSFSIISVAQISDIADSTFIQDSNFTGGRQFKLVGGKMQLLKSQVVSIALADTAVGTSEWHIFIVTYNGSTGECKFYLDGNDDGGATNLQSFTDTRNEFTIGALCNHPSPGGQRYEGFTGDIADLWYYGDVMSSSDRAGVTTALQTYYDL